LRSCAAFIIVIHGRSHQGNKTLHQFIIG
jgi:hypothetical protein